MTKRWSSVRGGTGETKRVASKRRQLVAVVDGVGYNVTFPDGILVVFGETTINGEAISRKSPDTHITETVR